MKINPYSIILIIMFNAIVSITNKTLKKNEYEKTINDSCFCPDDSTGFER